MSRLWHSKWLWCLPIGAAMLVLTLARILVPNVVGHGTHQQLGLPPCGFLLLTGLPCPGCGLTTAFAYLIRGRWLAAIRANAIALPLFMLCVAMPGWALWQLRQRSVIDALLRLPLLALTSVLAGSLLLAWAARVAALLL